MCDEVHIISIETPGSTLYLGPLPEGQVKVCLASKYGAVSVDATVSAADLLLAVQTVHQIATA